MTAGPHATVEEEITPPEMLVQLDQLVGIGELGGSHKDSKLVGTVLYNLETFVHALHGGQQL
jgi:hypothetical protein